MVFKNYNDIFSKNLNYILKKQGKRQMDLSKDLNIPKATVSSWCCGKRLPKFKKIQVIADYLGLKDPILLLSENIENFL